MEDIGSELSKQTASLTTDYAMQRWLEDDSEVRFSVKQTTFKNALFIINGHFNHEMWYSQLAEVFINIDNLELNWGEIIKKDGSHVFIEDMGARGFTEYVANKTFRIIVNPNGRVAKFNPKTFPYNITVDQARQIIRELVESKQIKKAASHLIQAKQYTLVEF